VDNRRVNYSPGQVGTIFENIFERAAELYPWEDDPEATDFSLSTPHDIRVGFAMWASPHPVIMIMFSSARDARPRSPRRRLAADGWSLARTS
jgi:hypothetical protein